MKNKIGTYASSTIDIQNWLNTPIQSNKPKRTKKSKEQDNAIFLELHDIVEDNDWKNLFINGYKGKFPSGFTFSNHVLSCKKKKNKIEKIEIYDSDIQTLQNVQYFFSSNGGFTPQDDEMDVLEFFNSCGPTYDSWTQIRGKKKKDFYIGRYIEQLCKKYNLNEKEKIQLHNQVIIGCAIKSIDSENIKLEDNEIKNIDNLIWDNSSRTFNVEGTAKNKKVSRKKANQERLPKNCYLSQWISYINKISPNPNKTLNQYLSQDLSTINSFNNFGGDITSFSAIST